jgi:pyruvate dehydrogenase E1 component alpha subunit
MSALHLDLLRTMLLIRRFEERCAELDRVGRVRGLVQSYACEEAVPAGVCVELHAEDWVVSTYRDHGHALARGVPLTALMAEVFGRATGCCRGRGGSMHVFDRTHRFVGGNGLVGGLPVALGLALGKPVQGLPGVIACFVREDAMAGGDALQVVDVAVRWRLPLLLCFRGDVAPIAAASGIAARCADEMDAVAVAAATQDALAEIRAGGGPVLLELPTHREHDPVDRLATRMVSAGAIDEAGLASVRAAVGAAIDRAVVEAEHSRTEHAADLGRFVHSETSTTHATGVGGS